MSEDIPTRPDIPDTFELVEDGKGIKCLHCGRVSYNPNDIEQRYCGNCALFHHDIWPVARAAFIQSGINPS